MFTTIVFSQQEGPTISKKLETPKETIKQILKKRASIWIDGQWKVENNQYIWKKGHWEAKRVGYVFVNGNWKKKSNIRKEKRSIKTPSNYCCIFCFFYHRCSYPLYLFSEKLHISG